MRIVLLIFLFFCITIACRERYGLPIEKSLAHSLVVEGNILQGDTTTIHLSRTTSVNDRQLLPETGATVTVEGNDNSTFNLSEAEPGVYKIAPIDLNPSTAYRLRIFSGNKEYESEWTTLINTSEIDKVFWERTDGVEIFVESSGSDDNSRYYKWDYEEVWDFYSKYKSYLFFTSNGVDEYGRPKMECIEKEKDGLTYTTCVDGFGPGPQYSDSMYHCWRYDQSNNINIGSTAALADNVMRAPIRKIEQDGFELTSLYSILVKQTGLSKEGYEFYKLLKGNSEGMGTMFDAQPSQLKTNIRCISDPGETVIGFINTTSVKTKRLFISNSEVGEWNYAPFTCRDTMYANTAEDVADAVSFSMLPVYVNKTVPNQPHLITEFMASGEYCVDCRLRGIHKRPDFWP